MSTTKRISENDKAPYFGWTKPMLLKECCELTNAAHNLKQQRDELLAAIKDYSANLGLNTEEKSCGHEFHCVCSVDRLATAIKKAEGGV